MRQYKTKNSKTYGKKVTGEEVKLVQNKTSEELEHHRNNARQIILWSNATPIRCRGGIGYACCFCSEEFPKPADLKKHTIEDHDDTTKLTFMKGILKANFFAKLDITGLQCNICKKSIDTIKVMMNHLKVDHDKKICTNIPDHLLAFKFDDDVLKCSICSNVYARFKPLLEHMNIHYRNYICETCDAGFVCQQKLKTHMKGHKTGKFKCDNCEQVFDTIIKKRFHEKRWHDGVLYYKCGYCNERFKGKWAKYEHLAKVHGVNEPQIKCQACDKTFMKMDSLRIHTKRDHLMQKPHKCTECDKAFFESSQLSMHMLKHTGVKEFQCEVCQKYLSRQKSLKEHMKIHNNDRRHKCEHCGQAFVQKCSWKGHMKSKHGEIV